MDAKNITEVQTPHGAVKYITTTKFLLRRAENLFNLEPETIAWIDQMDGQDSLWDIGANVGTYSIYASADKGIKVTAFEPEANNFSILNKNIRLNELQQKMLAYPIAVGSGELLNKLYLSDDQDGWACHSVGQDLDPFLRERAGKLPQGTICLGIDSIVASSDAAVPNHIKVDVDGLEHHVIDSATNLLDNSNLKSMLVELTLTLQEHQDVITKLTDAGFHTHQKLIDKTTIKEGSFKGMCNVIFARDKQILDTVYERIS